MRPRCQNLHEHLRCLKVTSERDESRTKIKELKTEIKELKEKLDFAHARQKIEESMWMCSLQRKTNKRDTQHVLEFWNRIMSKPNLFYTYVRMPQERFDDLHKRFVEYIEEHPNKTPQFSDIFVTQGNVCRYMSKYYLFMIIAYLRCGLSQWKIGGLFDLDQGTVSRHLAYVSKFLETNSSSVENIFEKIASCKTTREFKRWVPGERGGRIFVDGFETEIDKPKKSKDETAAYSGKSKKHVYRQVILTNQDKLILCISKVYYADTSEINILRSMFEDFTGYWEKLLDPNTPYHQRPEQFGDAAYVGLYDDMLGSCVYVPYKKPKNGELTQEQKEYNQWIAAIRIVVEHSVGMLRQFGCMNDQFEGTKPQFQRKTAAVASLVNHDILWDKENNKPSKRLIELEEFRRHRERHKHRKKARTKK